METINFLQQNLDNEISVKARYLNKLEVGELDTFDQIHLQNSEKAIKHYCYAIACLNTLESLKVS